MYCYRYLLKGYMIHGWGIGRASCNSSLKTRYLRDMYKMHKKSYFLLRVLGHEIGSFQRGVWCLRRCDKWLFRQFLRVYSLGIGWYSQKFLDGFDHQELAEAWPGSLWATAPGGFRLFFGESGFRSRSVSKGSLNWKILLRNRFGKKRLIVKQIPPIHEHLRKKSIVAFINRPLLY